MSEASLLLHVGLFHVGRVKLESEDGADSTVAFGEYGWLLWFVWNWNEFASIGFAEGFDFFKYRVLEILVCDDDFLSDSHRNYFRDGV